jgi:hypothetical protein
VAGVHFGNAILFISKISRAAHNFGVERDERPALAPSATKKHRQSDNAYSSRQIVHKRRILKRE